MRINLVLRTAAFRCLNGYRTLARIQDALKAALDQELEEVVFEYHHTKEDRWPVIKNFHIELSHQNFYYIIVQVTAMSQDGTPPVASEQEADVIDNFFQKILKRHIPDQDDLKINGRIYMFVTAPNPFR